MSRFTLPRDIYYGANALENLKNLKGSRAVLVLGGGSMKKFGFVDKALGYLKEAGIETRLIENVEPDPSVETVMSGAAVMREFEPDWIISMGGGSPIDAAKAMWAFYEYPETTFEDLITPFSFPELRQKARFCAIPSTSGTATEVTAFSVITDYQKGIKYPLADFNITPDVAIIDPALAETMPPKLVAHTGMDALTHAIEAYVSTLHTVFTDPLALKAIHIVEKDLLHSFNGDMGCREEMHYGQCLAGMAFSNALLGIVHSMAHKTGAAFSTGHITHGLANAMYLPYVIAYNAKADGVAERYADIARTMGVVGDTTAELVEGLRAKIRSMNDAMGIPNTLKDFGIIEDEFKEKLDAIAANAVGDAFRHIRDGYAEVMLCGGAEAAITPLSIGGFTSMRALHVGDDPSRASIPFDAERSGFVMGEGAAVLMLEEYGHALARGAKIYAEVVGYGATCDAYHITAPAPNGEGGARAMALALADAGASPEQVGYINAHGTSTPLNDSGETAAIKAVFGAHAAKLAVSSTKSMTGHMLGAAGAVEAIFTALALRDGFLPATIHYQVPDPACDLDYIPNQGREQQVEYALSNSLGFGGHNACVLFKKWEG